MKRITIFLVLVLCVLFPFSSVADDDWVEGIAIDYFAPPYNLPSPAYGENPDYRIRTRQIHDSSSSNSLFFELEIIDREGNKISKLNRNLMIYFPYPEGHDSAMGYDYKIEKQGEEGVVKQAHQDQAIAFVIDKNRKNPCGVYHITWGEMKPKPAKWQEIMSKMDWESDFCSYSVGAGDKKTKVIRTKQDITISGGEISGVMRFTHNDPIHDYETLEGWHTESGNYTFKNITLPDSIYIDANNGEDYKITFDASVKSDSWICGVLTNGSNLDLVINNTIRHITHYASVCMYIDDDCSMSLKGNGKIFMAEGEDAEAPILISLFKRASTNDEAIQTLKCLEGKFVVSQDLIKSSKKYPPISSYYSYMPYEDEPDRSEDVIDSKTGDRYKIPHDFFLRKMRPEKGTMVEPVLFSSMELDSTAQYRPLLVTSESEMEELFLRSEITSEVKGKSISYEIHTVDANNTLVPFLNKGTLYLPYPEEMDMEKILNYDVTIFHYIDNKAEEYSTKSGSVELTPYGFCINVSSLSPFEITWEEQPEVDLPQTGDNSHIALWLTLAGIATLTLKRKTA